MEDEINETDLGLSGLLTHGGLKPTLIVVPSRAPAEDLAEEDGGAEMEVAEPIVVDPSAFPSIR